MGLVDSHEEIDRKQLLMLQIAVLEQSLADSEASWKKDKFDPLLNPVAASIRRQIAEKEALLAG
jgi:hypothetical protein